VYSQRDDLIQFRKDGYKPEISLHRFGFVPQSHRRLPSEGEEFETDGEYRIVARDRGPAEYLAERPKMLTSTYAPVAQGHVDRSR